MTSTAKVFAMGSTLRTVSFVLNAVVGFLLMPLIVHALGDKMYGLWSVVGSFLGFYGLFDLGLSSAVQRYLSKALGTRDANEANIIINTSLFLFVLVGCAVIIATIILVLCAPFFETVVKDLVLFRKLILILGISLALNFPVRVFSGVLFSHIRQDLFSIIEIVKLAIRTVLILTFLNMGYGIIALAVINFFSNLMGDLLTYIVARKIAKYMTISVGHIDKNRIKAIGKYSLITFLGQVSDKLRFYVQNIVISAFIGLSSVTLYTIAASLIRYFIECVACAFGTGMMLPIFSGYEAKGDYNSIREKFFFMTRISGYLSMLIGGILIIFGHALIYRWMGDRYVYAYHLLVILVIPVIIDMIQNPSLGLLFGISKHKYLSLSNFLEGSANFILSLMLVKKYGLVGIALGSAIPMFVVKMIIQPVYVCRFINVRLSEYFYSTIFPVVLKSTLILVLFHFLFARYIQPSYSRLLLVIPLCVAVFIIIIYSWGFDSDDKKHFKKIFIK